MNGSVPPPDPVSPSPSRAVSQIPTPGPSAASGPRGPEPELRPQRVTLSVDADTPARLNPLASSRPSQGERFRPASVRLWNGQAWVRSHSEPGVGTWSVVDGEVEFTPASGFVGVATIGVRAVDTAGAAASSVLRVRVKEASTSDAVVTDPPSTDSASSMSSLDVLPKTGPTIHLAVLAGIALVSGAGGAMLIASSRRK